MHKPKLLFLFPIGLYDQADPEEGFWEIDAKQLEIFRDHTVNWAGLYKLETDYKKPALAQKWSLVRYPQF